MFRVKSPKYLISCFYNASRLMSKNAIRLESVGILQDTKIDECYVPGQLMIHRGFGYRGIILNVWQAKLDEKNPAKPTDQYPLTEPPSSQIKYYQVLVDNRDIPYLNVKTGVDSVITSNELNSALFIYPGIDYVQHSDVLPYTSREPNPIDNVHFKEYFRFDNEKEPAYVPTNLLHSWVDNRRQSVKVETVHREITDNIRITAVPFYVGYRLTQESEYSKVHYWRYLIRLENLGNEPVQLRERLWKIFSLSAGIEAIEGRGVVGLEPILNKEYPLFQYHSHVQLKSSGHMWGWFRFQRKNETFFNVKIPVFTLNCQD